MNLEDIRAFCLNLNGTSEGFPFGGETLVFKVGNKMFALVDADLCVSINLKCDPEKVIDLRERFQAVKPGYHMNKKHWNTVMFHEDMSDGEIYDLILHSYQLIFSSLPKKVQDELQVR